MGITGLFPLLRSVTDRVHLESLAGKTVAIDAYSWLHKGAYACAPDLFHSRPTRSHIDFCLNRLRLFLHHQIKVIMVFDGGPLPMKAGRETGRRQGREAARAKAEGLISEGRLGEAGPIMVRAIDITPEMAHQLIELIQKTFSESKVRCIVAPYEADAQLAFLEQRGIVDAVISEDSDLLLFGVKRLCVKLDGKTGYYEEVRADRISSTREMDLQGCSLKKLRQMCILSGCDYLDSINGMGLKTANRYLTKYNTIERVIQVLRAEGRIVPADYEERFIRAELTFCHQRIFNHQTNAIEYLSPIDENNFPFSDDSFLGPRLSNELGVSISKSDIHPVTFLPFTDTKPPSCSEPRISPFLSADRVTIKRPRLHNVEYTNSLYFPNTPKLNQSPANENQDKRQKTIRDYFK